MKKSDGGKGSVPRPFSVSVEEYGKNYDMIFKKKKSCGNCDKCKCQEKKDEKSDVQDL